MKISKKWKNVAIIGFGMFGLSTLSFNCAPGLFQSANFSSTSVGSNGVVNLANKFAEPISPYVLMTSKQVYESMLNLTGQVNRKTASQQTEFASRSQAMADTSNIASVNAPLQLGTTSVAGEICRKVINDEKNGVVPRKLFAGVDFTTGPSSQAAGYSAAVRKMALTYWGREPDQAESEYITKFYQDFTSGVASTAAETDKLYLATCAAMLASFDSMTY
jgi:hypothetical protein